MNTKNLLILIISFTLPILSLAASFEEGREAYLAKDYEKALSILKPKANQGHAKAQETLGTMYDFGLGVKKDTAKAIEWFEKAAAQGNSFVQHDLGVKYFKGIGITQDYDRAAAWWRMAADNGVAESQYNLGLMYARGLGFEEDSGMAVNWYSKAASQGHANAQYSLGVMYSFGQGVPQDYSKGLSFFQDAAEQNLPQAQYNLAVLLENGRGTEVDLPSAKRWYQRASEGGIEQATERLAAFNKPKAQPTPAAAVKKEILPATKPPAAVEESKLVTTSIPMPEPATIEALEIPKTKNSQKEASTQKITVKTLPKNHQVISGAVIEKPVASEKKKVVAEKPASTPESILANKIKSKSSPRLHNTPEGLDEKWIMSQPPKNYALQMIAFSREENARRYMKNLDLDGVRALYKSSMHGKTIYKVIYGRYDDHKASLKGRRELPKKYRDAKPFPRSFEFIQNDIKE